MTDTIWRCTRGAGPLVATAIHDGHEVRDDVLRRMAISEPDRLREEDPFTGRWTTMAPTQVVGLRSRFEVDLNRPREQAVYRTPADAWGLAVWHEPPPDALVAESLAEFDALLRCPAGLVRRPRRAAWPLRRLRPAHLQPPPARPRRPARGSPRQPASEHRHRDHARPWRVGGRHRPVHDRPGDLPVSRRRPRRSGEREVPGRRLCALDPRDAIPRPRASCRSSSRSSSWMSGPAHRTSTWSRPSAPPCDRRCPGSWRSWGEWRDVAQRPAANGRQRANDRRGGPARRGRQASSARAGWAASRN